ncbi:MAG: hypothetical protein IIU00_04935 [Clostridia bacterium]|nr:hypothetical protein [Clostridia bacterium]
MTKNVTEAIIEHEGGTVPRSQLHNGRRLVSFSSLKSGYPEINDERGRCEMEGLYAILMFLSLVVLERIFNGGNGGNNGGNSHHDDNEKN